MGKFFTRIIFAMLLAIAVLLPATNTAIAQGAQHNESDLDFTRRLTARIEEVEAQTTQLEKVVVRGWNPTNKESATAAVSSDEQGRIKVPLAALTEQSNSQRIRLDTHAAASRTENRPARLNREGIEASVSQMERDLAALKKDMDKRETTRK